MRVGTIKETKTEEYRVGLTPTGVRALTDAGHEVLVQRGAGVGSGFADGAFEEAGGRLLDTPEQVVAGIDLLVKVKEILPPEVSLLRPGLLLFTYLHLAPAPDVTKALLESRTNAVAYEEVRLRDGSLPLLIPMSRVAGRMAGEIAAQHLKKPGPGRGKLLGGIPGVAQARALVVGSGYVGTNAADVLAGLGARVTVVARNVARLASLEKSFRFPISTRVSTPAAIREELDGADVLIGGVLVPGETAPKLVSREMVRSMGEGAVIVDVCIDQGGICETSRPTTHRDPTFVEEGVVHYCVANMPGAVPRTSTEALTAETLPYVLKLAERGLDALREDEALAHGASTINGYLTDQAVARSQGTRYTPLSTALQR